MIQASIDLGTNTCLLLIVENLGDGSNERIIHDESTVVRLGQGVDLTGELKPEAMDRTFECLTRYAEITKKQGILPQNVMAVGTAQARDAKNAAQFFAKIKTELGFQFQVLSGDQEARATFLGAALPGMKPENMPENRVVMDIGGGSTEFVSFSGGKSLNIGAVRMSERFFKTDPVNDAEFWSCEAAIDEALQAMFEWRKKLPSSLSFVAVAGTAVTLAMIQLEMKDYSQNKINGITLSRGDVHRIVEELKWRTVDERKKMIGMEPKRADVMLAGALIFWRVMEQLDFASVTISTRGLRYGVLKAHRV